MKQRPTKRQVLDHLLRPTPNIVTEVLFLFTAALLVWTFAIGDEAKTASSSAQHIVTVNREAIGAAARSAHLDKESAENNCQLVTKLAFLGEEKLKKEKQNTERFERESPDRFGLSQKQFNELVNRQQEEQASQQATLEEVAKHNCIISSR